MDQFIFTNHFVQSAPALVSLASTLDSFASITSNVAHAYFLTGQSYHALPDPVPGLRNAFTISSKRELPDLITIFGMLQARLWAALAARNAGDEDLMGKEMWMANDLMHEAWWKVLWLNKAVANGPVWGYFEESSRDGEDAGEEYEEWMAALPECCGAELVKVREHDEQISSIEEWLDGVPFFYAT